MKVFKINGDNVGLLNHLNDKHHGTILFFHPHCSHCNTMKPDWEKMKETLQQEDCNLYEVDGQYMNEIHHPIKQTVDGFPTILNVNNGKLNAFEEQRNMENMKNFVLSNLPGYDVSTKKKATKRLRNSNVTFQLDGNKLMKKRRVTQGKPIKNAIRLTIANKKLKAKQQKTQKAQKAQKTQKVQKAQKSQKKKEKKGKNKK